jgi:hypothetical protein
MTSTFTPNKNLELPGFNDYVNSWNTPVNADFTAIDTALGGVTNLNATSVSGDVTLTSTQYRPFQIIVGGTLTANVRYLIPANVGGQWTVTNNTSGAFTLKIASAAGGSDITAPSGTIMVSCDGTASGMRLSNSGSYPGGLTGYVQFNTSGLFDGNANLFWDNTNGRLGIGTSTPDSSLTVVANNSNNAIRINQAGVGNAILVEDSANPDATPFVVDQNGNVGIGVTAPTSQVQIYNATTSSLLVTGDSTTSIVSSRASTDASAALENFRKYRGTIASPIAVASQDQVGVTSYSAYDGSTLRVTSQITGAVETYTNLNDLSGFLSFSTRPIGLGGVLAERMRIDASGNVGIGTNSPLQRFTAVNTSITGGAPASSGSAADPNSVARLQAGSAALDIGVYSGGQIWLQPRLSTNYATNYDIVLQPNGGNVGIGTSTPATKLHATSVTATTNAVTNVFRVDSQSSGTPATGIGVGIEFAAETSASNTEVGATIEAITTDVTAASEDFDLSFKTMEAGAAAAERLRITSSGDLKFNSGYGSVATAYGCRAWVNFNGTGTVAIRASGNVTSITDNGTGNYTVNFTSNIVDANYAVTGTASGSSTKPQLAIATAWDVAPTTSALRVYSGTTGSDLQNGDRRDAQYASIAIFR